MSAQSPNKIQPEWVVNNAWSYGPNEKDHISSRLYAVIGADNSGKSFVKCRGFGPEYKKLIKVLRKIAGNVTNIGTDVYLYPSDGYSLGLMKNIANEGRKLGFKYGAEIRLRAINKSIDPFSDGTLMGHVERRSKLREKVAHSLYREGLVAARLVFASTAEQAAEKVMKVILPDSPFSGLVHAVGGYVRDEYLGKLFPGKIAPPKDLDVVVEMKDGAKKITEYLHGILKNSKGEKATHSPHLLGAGYPIWSLAFFDDDKGNVKIGDKIYDTAGAVLEFADTQKETYPDPNSRQRVTEYGTLEEDIARRDFTVNMLLKDLTTGEIKDLTGVSKKHIEEGVLTKHPDVDFVKTVSEDPLRMLRLIRFQAKYGWSIPEEIKEVIRQNASKLNIVSAERITGELKKIMEYGKVRQALEMAKDLGFDQIEVKEDGEELNALSFLMNALKPMEMRHESEHHIDTPEKKDDKIIDHTLNVVDEAKNTVEAQLAALLHDIGKPLARAVHEDGKVKYKKHEIAGLDIAEEILRKFKLDSKTIKKVLTLVKNHMRPHSLENASDKALRKFIRDMGDDLDDVLDMAEADSRGKNPPNDYIHKLRKRIRELQNAKIPVQTKSVLDGNEIKDILGVKGGKDPNSGKIIGNAKKFILDLQDENPNLTKEEATKAIQEAYKKGKLD